MKKIGLIILLAMLFCSFDLPKSAQKKMNKTILSLWPNLTITKHSIKFSSHQKELLSFPINENDIFRLNNKEITVAYLFLAQAESRSDKIDYMVIFKPDLKILTVQILVYREEYGGEVGSKRWLKQFTGKEKGKAMEFGNDIQNISGATISARSITNGVKRLSKNIVELKNKGII